MDIQSKLKNVCFYFFRNKPEYIKVHIHEPSSENFHNFCVVINIKLQNKSFKGSSSAKNLQIAFLKALSELGENIIIERDSLESRAGVAGGFFFENAADRAKGELIERDAFLYHYKNAIPFISINTKKIEGLGIYELSSCLESQKVCLVLNQSYLLNDDQCLILGMGCDRDLEKSFIKAFSEYSSMYFTHSLLKGCGHQFMESLGIFRKADFHHSQSRAKENKKIFRTICIESSSVPKRTLNSKLWEITPIESPFRFIKYARADHPELLKMSFGVAEKTSMFKKLIYHPFW